MSTLSFNIHSLQRAFQQGDLSPATLLAEVMRRIDAYPDPAVWIHRLNAEQIQAQLAQATQRHLEGTPQPLLGIPFAVKDNIDVAGMPTTAGCPAFSYVATKTATVVQKLLDAGAILIGKTNLDQFAAGLVGTRSPYGAVRNAFNSDYISGGSSSGSAIAVSAGLVSFALGTDTAGSGRVPAAFGNIVGLKSTRGRLSISGVVPACRSIDCVSIFALNCDDARTVYDIAAGYDPSDPFSREDQPPAGALPSTHFHFGVLAPQDREFFGDMESAAMYERAIERVTAVGGSAITIDYAPFARAAALLYGGAWVAERYLVVKELLERQPEAIFPVTRQILASGATVSGADTFRAFHTLAECIRDASAQWKKMDLMLLPTAGTIYTIDQVQADPIKLNTNLGRYTNFVNLMDLCALAVPAGFKTSGVPNGVSLIAPAGQEDAILTIGEKLHRATECGCGVARIEIPPARIQPTHTAGMVQLAVVGAHLSGMPLNHQLTDRGARLVRTASTAPIYRFYALPGTTPPKPALVRTVDGAGGAIELEIWEMSTEAFGSFVAAIPGPLGIGMIQLHDGTQVQGFLCEAYAVASAPDITHHGGWRGYVRSLQAGNRP